MRNIALLMFLVCSTALTTAAGQPSHLKEVSLKVTVNANQQFSSPPGISTDVKSDTLGPYIDGQNHVWATLDTSGDLYIYLSIAGGKKGNSTSRQLGVDLRNYIAPPTTGASSCTGTTPVISPSNPPTYRSWIRTWPVTDETYPTAPAFQNMTVDASGNTVYYVDLAIEFIDPSQTIYFLAYHQVTGPFVDDGAKASRAQVRRTSATRWVVEPVAPSGLAGNPPNVAMLIEETITNTPHQSQVTLTECGFYQAPFSITLEAQ